MYTTPQLAAEYSAIADPYSRLWSPVIRPMALPILEMLPLAKAREILDVGAGTGELFEDLTRRAPQAHIMGVDRSAGMLRVAQARGGALLAVMDAQRLAFADAVFDVAVCVNDWCIDIASGALDMARMDALLRAYQTVRGTGQALH